MTIGQQIYNGMAAAGWLLGFLILFAGSLIAMILIGYAVMLMAKAGDKAATRKEVTRHAAQTAVRHNAPGHAAPVGRHMRPGA